MMRRVMDGKFVEGKDQAVVSDAASPALLVLSVGGRRHRRVAGKPVRRQSP